MYSVKELATACGVGPATVRGWINRNVIRFYRDPQIKIPQSEARKMIYIHKHDVNELAAIKEVSSSYIRMQLREDEKRDLENKVYPGAEKVGNKWHIPYEHFETAMADAQKKKSTV
jgi:hypothetical protein